MNALFGRSKSKHRKAAGSLKDRIGNPTPIDPININGTFIDLRLSPQDGRSPLADAPPPPPSLGAKHVILPPRTKEWYDGDSRSDSGSPVGSPQRHHQSNPPTRPRRPDSNSNDGQFEAEKPYRGSGEAGGHEYQEAGDFVSSGYAGSNQM